jgi:Protein of unknown function (DUF3237)
MSELRSRPLFTLRVYVHPRHELGTKCILPVAGGDFDGERLRGTVLADGGADWLTVRADGVFQQDVRMTLQTDDGAIIGMRYSGIRHGPPDVNERLKRGEYVSPDAYYLRTVPFFETCAAQYAWINNIVAVGVGERLPNGAAYAIYEVL